MAYVNIDNRYVVRNGSVLREITGTFEEGGTPIARYRFNLPVITEVNGRAIGYDLARHAEEFLETEAANYPLKK